MPRGVNGRTAALRAEKVAATEERLITAARTLLLRQGYLHTTLAAVAVEAGVAERTVYLRFGTKVALFRRVLDVAVVGATAPVDLAHRDWVQRSLTAATLDERIALRARGTRDLMSRLGPLLPIAEEAAAIEPDLRAAWRAAREATRENVRSFWHRAGKDGLLPDGCDLRWLVDTATLLMSADGYLRGAELLGWDPRSYERWLITTSHRLITAASG
jgi:AcrR family transcriptional regulator